MTDLPKLKRRIGAARKFWERTHCRPTRGGKPTALVLAIANAEKVSPDVVARVVAAALAQAELEALGEFDWTKVQRAHYTAQGVREIF